MKRRKIKEIGGSFRGMYIRNIADIPPKWKGIRNPKKLSIYLDTSVFSAYYDERNLERMHFTQSFWDVLKEYRLYTSDLALNELSTHPDLEKRKLLLQLALDFEIMDSKVANDLAREYMGYKIFPRFYGINILISWNFKHIVKRKTRRMIAMVNSLLDYSIPEIVSPFEF